jgi:hypothetical protein
MQAACLNELKQDQWPILRLKWRKTDRFGLSRASVVGAQPIPIHRRPDIAGNR